MKELLMSTVCLKMLCSPLDVPITIAILKSGLNYMLFFHVYLLTDI